MKNLNNKPLVIINVLVFVLLLLLVLNIIMFLFTGSFFGEKQEAKMSTFVEKKEVKLPRHIFYRGPMAYSDFKYAETCYPKGEVMAVLPDNKCCEGLDSLGIIDESQEECNFVLGIVLCSDCGNKRCEFGENDCNCPEDCTKPPKRL